MAVTFYAITRDGAWLRAFCYHPGEVVVQRSGRRVEVARAILFHATGEDAVASELAGPFTDEFLSVVPDGGVPLAVHTADLLLWVVRRLAKDR